MADTIRSLFWCHRRFLRDAQPRTRRSKAQETAVAIDDPKIALAEARDVTAALVLGQADELAGQCLADEHVLAAPLDRPRRTYSSHFVVCVIPRVLETRRQSVIRRLPARRRWRLLQRLVRPLLVVVPAEQIEARLLLARIRRGGLGGLRLQCSVHALVPAVVLRARRRDVARLHPELQPPNRQRREPAGTRRTEWRSVVGPDRVGQAGLLEYPLQSTSDARPRRFHDPHLDQIPACRIRYRQRIAARPIGRAKPALEIDPPFLVGRRGRRHHLALRDCTAAAPTRLDETLALQNVPDRRRRRPGHLRSCPLQPRLDLLRAEMRKSAPCRDDALGQPPRRRVRTAHDSVAAILKPACLPAVPAPLPNIKRLPADAVPSAQLGNRKNPRLILNKQRDTLFHRTGLLERHRPISSNRTMILTCQASTRSKLSALSPVYTGSPPPLAPPHQGEGKPLRHRLSFAIRRFRLFSRTRGWRQCSFTCGSVRRVISRATVSSD